MFCYETSEEEYVKEGRTVLIEDDFCRLGAEDAIVREVLRYYIIFIAIVVELETEFQQERHNIDGLATDF